MSKNGARLGFWSMAAFAGAAMVTVSSLASAEEQAAPAGASPKVSISSDGNRLKLDSGQLGQRKVGIRTAPKPGTRSGDTFLQYLVVTGRSGKRELVGPVPAANAAVPTRSAKPLVNRARTTLNPVPKPEAQ